MTGYLLDTNVVIAWLEGTLPVSVVQMVADPTTDVRVSAAVPWEIGIKRAKGQLSTPDDLLEVLDAAGFELLAITADHAWRAAALPRHHADPFDRVMVAQAQAERLTLVTRDRMVPQCDVSVLAV